MRQINIRRQCKLVARESMLTVTQAQRMVEEENSALGLGEQALISPLLYPGILLPSLYLKPLEKLELIGINNEPLSRSGPPNWTHS
jgi:hypothetical protein